MKVKAGLLIDLGNSETRYGTLVNNEYKTGTLSNAWGLGGVDYEIPEDYANDDKSVVMVLPTESGLIRYAWGKVVQREFSFAAKKPNAQSKKMAQEANLLSLRMAMYTAMKEISMVTKCPLENLDIAFSIALLLPPEEQQRDGKLVSEYVKNIKSIEITYPIKAEYKVEVDSVRVIPEGLAAFIAVCFKEENGEIVEREENKPFLSGQNLIIDIGAGTTDFIRVEDSELISSSRATYQKGGNTVEAYLKRALKTKYGVTNPNIKRVVSEGILEQGLDEIDVTEEVSKAKLDYTRNLNNDIIAYIEAQSMDIKNLKGILLTGGGCMPTKDKEGKVKVPAMSDLLTIYIKQVAPQIRTINTVGINPRYMNLEGLKLIYKYI